MDVRDPLYRSAPARWVRRRLRHYGVDLVVEDQLPAPYAADPATGTIWLPPGLALPDVMAGINRCVLYLEGGSAWAEEFGRHERQNVVPFRRRR